MLDLHVTFTLKKLTNHPPTDIYETMRILMFFRPVFFCLSLPRFFPNFPIVRSGNLAPLLSHVYMQIIYSHNPFANLFLSTTPNSILLQNKSRSPHFAKIQRLSIYHKRDHNKISLCQITLILT